MTIKEFNHITEFLDYLYQLQGNKDNTKIDEFFQNLQLMVRLNKGDTISGAKYLSGYSTTPISFMGYLDSSYLKALNEIHELKQGVLYNKTEKEKIKQLFLLVGFDENFAKKILKDLCSGLPCDVYILIKFPSSSDVDISKEYKRTETNINIIEKKILDSKAKKQSLIEETPKNFQGELDVNSKLEALDNGIVPTKENLLQIFKLLYPEEYELVGTKLENLDDFFKEMTVSSGTYTPIKDYLDPSKKTMENWETHYGNVTSVILCNGTELGYEDKTANNLFIIRIKMPKVYVNYCEDIPKGETHEKNRRKLIIEDFKKYKDEPNKDNYVDMIEVKEEDYAYVIRRLLHIRNNFNSLFQGDGKTYSEKTGAEGRKYEIITRNVDITKKTSANWAVIKLFQKQVYAERYVKRNLISDVKQLLGNFLNTLANNSQIKSLLKRFEGKSPGAGAGAGTGGGKVNNSYKLKTKKLNTKNRNRKIMTKKN